MPVWFDTWEMGTGDSFEDKIAAGIGESDYVVVVLSSPSVASDWVQRELETALGHEERRGRSCVIPIRIADCEIPVSIAGRLYADFSVSYLEPLEQLVAQLRRLGVGAVSEPPEHAVVPLVFEKGIYLERVQLKRRIDSLLPRLANDFEFKAEQFIIAPDEQYLELRRRMIERKEHILGDPYYSPAVLRSVQPPLQQSFRA